MLDRIRHNVFLCLAGSSLAAACSGSGVARAGGSGLDAGDAAAPSCAFEPCGGGLVGMWQVVSVCGKPPERQDPLAAVCPSSTAAYRMDGQGCVEFYEDGTYEIAFTLELIASLGVPRDCWASFGASDCTELAATTGMSCTMDGETLCACERSLTEPHAEAGAWEVDGLTLVTTPSDPGLAAETDDYCVDQTRLWIRPVGGPWSMQLDRL
ncbi:MAG: hypothetical protein AABZ30_12355 [Myxococcota bacterium]